jgi:hypothetical protein
MHYLYHHDGTKEAIGHSETEAFQWLTEQGYDLEGMLNLLLLELVKEEKECLTQP